MDLPWSGHAPGRRGIMDTQLCGSIDRRAVCGRPIDRHIIVNHACPATHLRPGYPSDSYVVLCVSPPFAPAGLARWLVRSCASCAYVSICVLWHEGTSASVTRTQVRLMIKSVVNDDDLRREEVVRGTWIRATGCTSSPPKCLSSRLIGRGVGRGLPGGGCSSVLGQEGPYNGRRAKKKARSARRRSGDSGGWKSTLKNTTWSVRCQRLKTRIHATSSIGIKTNIQQARC